MGPGTEQLNPPPAPGELPFHTHWPPPEQSMVLGAIQVPGNLPQRPNTEETQLRHEADSQARGRPRGFIWNQFEAAVRERGGEAVSDAPRVLEGKSLRLGVRAGGGPIRAESGKTAQIRGDVRGRGCRKGVWAPRGTGSSLTSCTPTPWKNSGGGASSPLAGCQRGPPGARAL